MFVKENETEVWRSPCPSKSTRVRRIFVSSTSPSLVSPLFCVSPARGPEAYIPRPIGVGNSRRPDLRWTHDPLARLSSPCAPPGIPECLCLRAQHRLARSHQPGVVRGGFSIEDSTLGLEFEIPALSLSRVSAMRPPRPLTPREAFRRAWTGTGTPVHAAPRLAAHGGGATGLAVAGPGPGAAPLGRRRVAWRIAVLQPAEVGRRCGVCRFHSPSVLDSRPVCEMP